MATPQKQQPSQPKKTATPARAQAPRPAVKKSVASNVPRGNQVFLFDSTNYKWMAAGVALILIGFFLMAGGKSANPHQFLYDEIYSFRRITLAPMVILIGTFIEVYAIMKKPTATAQ
ncbi:MAG TPA: DUF3098 domain-containing protein [Flavipsychrobacter sp.]|nr:DUF3098 domain-containing protein [Flavipsychrobacter sp.]